MHPWKAGRSLPVVWARDNGTTPLCHCNSCCNGADPYNHNLPALQPSLKLNEEHCVTHFYSLLNIKLLKTLWSLLQWIMAKRNYIPFACFASQHVQFFKSCKSSRGCRRTMFFLHRNLLTQWNTAFLRCCRHFVVKVVGSTPFKAFAKICF